LCDLGEDSDESDVDSSFDPLARYRDLQQSQRKKRQIIEDNLAYGEEEFLSDKEEFSSNEEEFLSDE
jgi:hypothetical protein